jgi:long-chain acyl-CoA synthetase
MAGLYTMFMAGVTIAYAENIESVAANAVEVRPTILNGVPRFYEKVYARVMDNANRLSPLQKRIFHWGLNRLMGRARAHFAGRADNSLLTALADLLVAKKIRARVGGRLQYCISGGAALPPHVLDFFFAIGITVLEGYGLTETSPVITLNPPGHERRGSVGTPLPGVEIRIGEEGEILTRGPHVFQGYLNREEETKQALRDGWFHTGDIGRIDSDGYLYITDRLKDLLVTAGGKKVAPQPLEVKLKQSPIISEAVLLGDQKPFIVALLIPEFPALELAVKEHGWSFPDHAAMLAAAEVRALYQAEIDKLNSELSQFEKVKRFTLIDAVFSPETGELTPSLKVRRKIVMEKYATTIAQLYT